MSLFAVLRRLFDSCAFGVHRLVIPTGANCWEPIFCRRCGRTLDADTGRWVRP